FYTRLKAGKPVFCTTAVRDFLDMRDFLAFMDLAIREEAPTGIYNLGPGVGYSIKDVLLAVAAALKIAPPSSIDVRPVGADDVEKVILDPTATQTAFSWKHAIPFEEAIAGMVRWYDQYGVSAIHTHLKPPASKS
ncbi:MAG: hypothetical protein ACTHLY_12740, partial [Pseudolabrys sp.]